MIDLKKILAIENNKEQAGAALYLAIIVFIILLAIVLGLTTIFVGQMRMVQEMGYSVIALSAADAGIEAVLMDRASPVATSSSLLNNATYAISILDGPLTNFPGQEYCTSTDPMWSYCITSVGEFRGIRRGVEVAY